eukprot:146393-Alexandrium_andersonii.AAC.1
MPALGPFPRTLAARWPGGAGVRASGAAGSPDCAMDSRWKRIAHAVDVAGQLRPRLAPKAEELRYSLLL